MHTLPKAENSTHNMTLLAVVICNKAIFADKSKYNISRPPGQPHTLFPSPLLLPNQKDSTSKGERTSSRLPKLLALTLPAAVR